MIFAAILEGCATPAPPRGAPSPITITPPAEVANAPVARVPMQPPPAIVVTPTAPLPSTATAPPALQLPFPGNVIYMCLTSEGGQPRQTAIEFIPKVHELCRRHPEMGPCQYEREVCRRAGGRVFAADGTEITRRIEDEYDKRVYRVRFRAD